MGRRCRLKRNPVSECFAPYTADDYAPVLAEMQSEAHTSTALKVGRTLAPEGPVLDGLAPAAGHREALPPGL